MKRVMRYGGAAAVAAVMAFTLAPETNVTHDTQQDDFARVAYMSNCAEISAGNLAVQKAKDPKVAEFGRMMVADHTDANTQLLAITGTAPSTDSLDAEHKALKDSLMAMTGEKFDALYVQSQIRDHQKAIALFQKQATDGQKQELKAYAQKLLPKIKMHLQHVQDMSKKK